MPPRIVIEPETANGGGNAKKSYELVKVLVLGVVGSMYPKGRLGIKYQNL